MAKNKLIPKEYTTNNNAQWTPRDLQSWVKAGLVPKELAHPSKNEELQDYLKENHDKIYSHYHLIDPRTGELVKILEQTTNFEICEGVCLRINPKEINEWKIETQGARKLTKDQTANFKTFLSQFGSDRPLRREEIKTFIEEITKPRKTPKYRQSGHLVDEKLKYSKPTSKQSSQLSLFDLLSPDTQHKIREAKVEITAEGIKLTPPENKLLHAINRLLYEKSENKNTKSEEFYSGNAPSELVPYGGQKQKSVLIKFKPSELYKAYMGQNDYSGADVKYINSVLYQLEDKKVLIKYDRIKKVKRGKIEETLTDRIEGFHPLIKIVSFISDLTDEEKAQLDSGNLKIREKREEIVVALNPIFTDQIDTKFIEFPVDINRRLIIAAGGHKKVTSSMQTLMEYMIREMSAKRYKAEINEDNFYYMLGLELYVKQNRKKRLQERVEKDIEAITKMGIISSAEKKPNSTGGFKWIFNLNKDYD